MPTGTLTVLTTNPTVGDPVELKAVFSGVASKSHAEISLVGFDAGTEVYLDVQTASGGGDTDSPWTATFAFVPGPAYVAGDDLDVQASLYYYTWSGQKETGVVNLASVEFTAAG